MVDIKDIEKIDYKGPYEITSSKDMYDLAMACQMHVKEIEHALLVTLNNEGLVTGIFDLGTSEECEFVFNYDEIQNIANKMKAPYIAIATNHPSENQWPTEDEMQEARKLYFDCLENDMYLKDYVIITPEIKNRCSLKEHGIFDDDFEDY